MAKYIKPSIDLEAFTCPHCNTLSRMIVKVLSYSYGRTSREPYLLTSFGETRLADSWIHIARCQTCNGKTIWVDGKYAYPDLVSLEPNPDMPASVLHLYKEAGMIYNKSPRAACALLRLAIDRLCNHLGETDRDINKNIAALVKKGLPEHVQKALDIVRVVGNKAVHPGQIALDVDNKETAEALMRLLNIITERMITEPKTIDEMYSLLPQTARDSIEKRDK